MSAEFTDAIDRRDFVLSSLATVGASAALVTSTEVANAQDSCNTCDHLTRIHLHW